MKKQNKLKNNSHILNTIYSAEELKDIASNVQKDFEYRSEERRKYESQWLINLNFLLGNQYCAVSNNGELEDYDKQFFWQEREVYNHITPIFESRMSKLNRVRPTMTVIPANSDEKDIYTAKVSKKIIESCKHKLGISDLVTEATMWSEITGTVFYKIMWDDNAGEIIGETEKGDSIYEGDVKLCVCPPYEIYPDNLTINNLNDCKSIIHARAYDVDEIKLTWGLDIDGKDVNVYSLDTVNSIGGLGFSSNVTKACAKTKKNNAVVIEKYEQPSENYPEGRLIIVCEDKVLHIDTLPYINKVDSKRGYPFVKQVSNNISGNFWGVSIIERLIPVQRAYNAVKNRKHEYLNRLSMGVLTVEDGSVDIDNLTEEGMSPGKIIVYRQGSNPPSLMATGKVPTDFIYEENSLLNEFTLISGVSDLMRSSSSVSSNISGTALQTLIEQDEAKLTQTADNMRYAQKEIAAQILRLYKQFSVTKRAKKIIGCDGSVDMFYFNSSDITSDDIIFETENEMGQTISQKRNMVFDLLNAGLLTDEQGKLSMNMKSKVLEMLGFGVWEGAQDLSGLHIKKADSENIALLKGEDAQVLEIDDHKIHINEHIAFMLSNEFNSKIKKQGKTLEQKFLSHIASHKQFNKLDSENILNNK